MNFAIDELGTLLESSEWARRLFAESNWRALAKYGSDLKEDVRANVRKSKIARAGRLAGSWRGRMFPANAKAHADRPAFVIGTNAPHIVETFEEGPVIKSKGGGLLIPIGPARRIKLAIGEPRSALKRKALAMYGAQRLVSRRLKRTRQLALGVYTGAEGGGRKFIPLFVIVRQVQAPKLLKGYAIIEEGAKALPARASALTFREFEYKLNNSRDPKAEVWRRTVGVGAPFGGATAPGLSR